MASSQLAQNTALSGMLSLLTDNRFFSAWSAVRKWQELHQRGKNPTLTLAYNPTLTLPCALAIPL